jgi:periplasmic protein TonB
MKKNAPPPAPKITDHDRLGLTFFLAAIFHGILILGVTFSIAPAAQDPQSPTLDVIIVQTQSPNQAEDAKYLAQVSQQGGGDSEEKTRPRDLFTAPTLSSEPGVAMQTSQQQLSSQAQKEELKLLHQDSSNYSIDTEKQANAEADVTRPAQENQLQILQTARLAEELSAIIENTAERPKVKYMNSSTKEFLPARYMREWINRVERIGNLNYPDQARREKLNGTLILDVAINSNGELMKTDLRRSSGHQLLDDAAQRIVKLAAPFPPFPAKLKEQADVIHITRSWEFLANNQIRTE